MCQSLNLFNRDYSYIGYANAVEGVYIFLVQDVVFLLGKFGLSGLFELDRGRVDGFEVFIALVVDFAEAVIEREALLGQCYFEFGVTPPTRKIFLQCSGSRSWKY